MAASYGEMENARIILDFFDCSIERSWFLLAYSEMPTVSTVAEEIVKRHKQGVNATLYLKGCWLPPWEKSAVIKDEDCITVRFEKCSVLQSKETGGEGFKNRKRKHGDISSDASHSKKKKKKEKSKETLHQTDSTEFSVIADNSSGTMQSLCAKKKKKKRKSSEKEEISSIDTSTWTESQGLSDTCNTNTSKDKNSIAVTEQTVNEDAKHSMVLNASSSVSTDNTYKENNHLEIAVAASQSVSQTSDGVGDQEVKTKRKRNRKHRKRQRPSEDTSISSCDGSQGQYKNKVNQYKGRDVGKEELFFGSIPDKLISPKYYRHGYRNLNVYEPLPNKHELFKSDSEEEKVVQEGTEQYNFLSSTGILEEREQYRQREGGSVPDDSGLVDSSINRIIDVENVKDISLESQSMDTADTQLTAKRLGRITESEDIFVAHTNEGELPRESIYDNTKWNNATMNTIDSDVSETDTLVHKKAGVTENSNQYSGRPGPSVLYKQTLPNGVSVFKRQRRNMTRGAVRELSKEEQLDTACSNVSTVFKVPSLPSPSSRKHTGQQQELSQNVHVDHSPTHNSSSWYSSPQHRPSPWQQDKHEMSAIQQDKHEMSSSQDKHEMSSTQQNKHEMSSSRDKHEMSSTQGDKHETHVTPTQRDSSLTQTMSNGNQHQGVSSKDNGHEGSQSNDYTQFSPLVEPPVVGMVIAYKVLEISVNCNPEISGYKEAEVLGKDNNGMLTLKSLQPKQEVHYNKFHVEIEDTDCILTNTGEQPDQVTLHVSSLLETRVIRRP